MRLRTFGGLWIEGVSPPGAPGPRPLALLALVAAAGHRGISRDRAVGLLWAESGEVQARHALSQTLYRLKRETGGEWLIAGPTLRLDPAATSDIVEFQAALSAGDHEAAAALYAGPFLDGFYLPGAPEFDRWVEDERARLARAVTSALEQLATGADRHGEHAAAIEAWTRLTELDPLSARFAAGRMRALASAGDQAGALAHARTHEGIVRRELDADLDPSIRALASSLRTGRPESDATPRRSAEPGPGPAAEPSTTGDPAAAPIIPPAPAEADQPRSGPSWRLAAGTIAVAAVALTLTALALRSRDRPETPVLSVGTIRTPEGDEVGSAGAVLRDLLATTLGGLHGVQVVANSRLVELTPLASSNEPGATEDAARRAGASEILEGELTREGTTLVLALRRVDLGRGVVRRGYVVRAANRYALVDSAAATVARDLGLAPPSLPAREVRTTSAEAYALYSEGLRAYYGLDGPGAYRLMNAALQHDSGFAMAAYYAWLIGETMADDTARRRAFDLVKRLATRTIERERLLIQAEAARRESPVAAAVAIAETLTVRYPADPDGHIVLGFARFDHGDFAGSVAAFRQAFVLDSVANSPGPFCRSCLALTSMIQTYHWWDSAGTAEVLGRRLVALRPDDPAQWGSLTESLLRQGRRAEAEAALARSGVMSLSPRTGTFLLNRDLIRWGRLEELDRRLLTEVLDPGRETRGDARWLLTLSLRDQGRLREALALGLEGRIPGTSRQVPEPGPERILTAMMIADRGRPDSAARLLHAEARRTLASRDMRPGQRNRNATWYLTLAGTAYAAAGDTATVRRLADSTETLGQASTFGRDLVLHQFLRGLLLQREERHAEAVEAFRRSLFSLTDGYTRINLAMARSLLALGRPEEAIAVLRPAIHGGVDGSNTYTSRTELHEALAEAFARAGQRDSAAAHYREVERAWRHADPEYAERYARAQAAAAPPAAP